MAATVTTTAETMAALPAAGGTRPRNLIATGTALLCAGATTLFGALFAAYIELRARIDVWPPEDLEFDIYLGNMLVITMLLASLSAQWAVSAVKRDEHRQATVALAITAGFGVAFVNLLSFTAGRLHLPVDETAYAGVVAAMAALLGIVVLIAVGFAITTAIRVKGEQVAASEPDLARANAWFWHYATLVTIVVWFAVVVLK